MLKSTSFLTAILLSFFASQYTFAQQGSVIDSLKILPNNPDENQTIQLIVYATFPTGDCNLSNHTIDIVEGDISVMLNYEVGDLTVICHAVDTISIGNLNPRDYLITANLTVNLLDAIFDTDTLSFEVDEVLGLDEKFDENDLVIYPNPFHDGIQIRNNSASVDFSNLEIYTVLGTLVAQRKLDSFERIDVSDLKVGIYFVVLSDQSGNRFTKKVLKTAL